MELLILPIIVMLAADLIDWLVRGLLQLSGHILVWSFRSVFAYKAFIETISFIVYRIEKYSLLLLQHKLHHL